MGWPPEPEGADVSAIEAARQGDVGAFNRLVLAHQERIYNLCLRSLGSREDAADATQETFLHAYRSLCGFSSPPAAFRGWLQRIAVNACYDALRRRRRRPATSLDALMDPAEVAERGLPEAQFAADDPPPDTVAEQGETARVLEQGLATLSADHRLTVVLCDVQGLSYEEAAAAMSVEVGTVKSRLSRARARLREYLRQNGELPTVVRRLDGQERESHAW